MGIKQRLHPDVGSMAALVMHCAHARYVWNLALEQANWYQAGRPATPNYNEQARQLGEARREFAWLGAGSSSVQQGALRDFDRAMRNWWSGLHGRPTWRKANVHNGFLIRDLVIRRLNRRWGLLSVPKSGYVRFRITREWTKILAASSARVKMDRSGRWWVSFTCPKPMFVRASTGAISGIDRGVANSIATSDGWMDSAPTLTAGEKARFVSLQRRLERQDLGSQRRAQTRVSLARLHGTLADRRKNWIEQTSTHLVRQFDMIGIEDLRTRRMTKRAAPRPDPNVLGAYLPNGARAKSALNRAILASCWGGLERRLVDKTSSTPAEHASVLVKVNPRNTSRTCAVCGHVAKENRESQAVFVCQSCGHEAHADTNAAVNIRELAVKYLCGQADRERTQKPGRTGSVNHPDGART